MTGCPFITGTPTGRAFVRKMKGGGKNELKQMLKYGAYNFRISNGPFPTVPLCLSMNSEKNHIFFVYEPMSTYP